MTGEFPRALTVLSGLVSLAIGLYVLLNGRERLVNRLFFLMTAFLCIWAIAEGMTFSVTSFSAKEFWTKFQGIGELPLVPTYLLIALYFPFAKNIMRDKRRAVAVITALYSPFVLGLVLLYTTRLVCSSYLPSSNIAGLNVRRAPFFWILETIGFLLIFIAIAIYMNERAHTASRLTRNGLLLLALAPVPVLAANLVQNFDLNSYLTATQASVISVIMLAIGVLRYGLFIDLRYMTKRMIVHASILAANLALFSLICALYFYAMHIRGAMAFILVLITTIPFMLAYGYEFKLVRGSAVRYLRWREEEEESRLLRELGASIRSVGKIEDLSSQVVVRLGESLGLTGCVLMLKEEDIYSPIGYYYEVRGFGSRFKDVVGRGFRAKKWPAFYSFEDEDGSHSGYWSRGDEIVRGKSVLSNLSVAFFRVFGPDGKAEERMWKEGKDGQAISVPLEVAGEEVGLLWVIAGRERGRFSLEEWDFLVSLSTQVAVSLKNAQLLQELLDKSKRLQELIQGATTAQEEERIRISRELHDGLAPYFLDIIYQLDMLAEKVGGEPQIAGTLDDAREKARTGLRDLRKVISDLRPSSLDVLGLKKSLRTYLERFGAENNIGVEFKALGELDRIDPLVEVTTFRIAQEALANVGRHAGASRVVLALDCENGNLDLTVADDGIGFMEREIRDRMLNGDCLGIKGMTERAELMQGRLNIDSIPGEGTTVRFSVPLPESEAV
jgi:signal transduction histidine kinase